MAAIPVSPKSSSTALPSILPGGDMNFSNLTLDNVDKVEIVHGAVKRSLGSDAMFRRQSKSSVTRLHAHSRTQSLCRRRRPFFRSRLAHNLSGPARQIRLLRRWLLFPYRRPGPKRRILEPQFRRATSATPSPFESASVSSSAATPVSRAAPADSVRPPIFPIPPPLTNLKQASRESLLDLRYWFLTGPTASRVWNRASSN